MEKSVPDLSVIVHLMILKRNKAEIRIQHYNISKKCKENYDEIIRLRACSSFTAIAKRKCGGKSRA
jgi:hypothetical protein